MLAFCAFTHLCLCKRLHVKERNKTSICVSVWEPSESSCEVKRGHTKRGSLTTAHCSGVQLGNTNRWSVYVRVSVYMCVVCVLLCSAHTGPEVSLGSPAHTLPRSAALPDPYTQTKGELHPRLPLSLANRQDHALFWNRCLAAAFRSVWSPTSFSASVGRKWPNTPAPVLHWTHCCHIKAQICTVAQLKFPTLPAPPHSQPHTFRTNGRAE